VAVSADVCKDVASDVASDVSATPEDCCTAGSLSVMTVPCGALSVKPTVPPIFSASVLQEVLSISSSSSSSSSSSISNSDSSSSAVSPRL
jgi:hypothetical protein